MELRVQFADEETGVKIGLVYFFVDNVDVVDEA
jgi:hypothetical protein